MLTGTVLREYEGNPRGMSKEMGSWWQQRLINGNW